MSKETTAFSPMSGGGSLKLVSPLYVVHSDDLFEPLTKVGQSANRPHATPGLPYSFENLSVWVA